MDFTDLAREEIGRLLQELVKEKWITHYSSSHIILLVGEGDFSFSASLATALGSGKNMVATSFLSKRLLRTRHCDAAAHIAELKSLHCTVLHGVDVNHMHKHQTIKVMKFDRIIFNFPHAGHDPLYCERDSELIRRHKELVKAFFASAGKMLSDGGEIHVAHRNDYPYNLWKLKKLAKKAGLFLVEMVEFKKEDYPGYHNKRGGEIKSNKTFPLGDCFTFKFSLGSRLQSGERSTSKSVGGHGDLAKFFSDLYV